MELKPWPSCPSSSSPRARTRTRRSPSWIRSVAAVSSRIGSTIERVSQNDRATNVKIATPLPIRTIAMFRCRDAAFAWVRLVSSSSSTAMKSRMWPMTSARLTVPCSPRISPRRVALSAGWLDGRTRAWLSQSSNFPGEFDGPIGLESGYRRTSRLSSSSRSIKRAPCSWTPWFNCGSPVAAAPTSDELGGSQVGQYLPGRA